jgi:hypothetical protein
MTQTTHSYNLTANLPITCNVAAISEENYFISDPLDSVPKPAIYTFQTRASLQKHTRFQLSNDGLRYYFLDFALFRNLTENTLVLKPTYEPS